VALPRPLLMQRKAKRCDDTMIGAFRFLGVPANELADRHERALGK
jgi:hypothetical protein